MQLRTINFLQENKALNEKIYKCAKSKIKGNLQFCTASIKPLQLNTKKG